MMITTNNNCDWLCYCTAHGNTVKNNTQAQHNALNRFFSKVERRAFRMAEIATGNPEDALELVQEAMLGLVKRYSHKQEADWPPLFYRILQSRILDFHRRRGVRNKVMSVLHWLKRDDEDSEDPIQQAPASHGWQPEQQLQDQVTNGAIMEALKNLPIRQQQTFMLRAWEGLSVADTALAMGCSEGSIKTHYSRALHTLQEQLEAFRP